LKLKSHRWRKLAGNLVVGISALYLILLIPDQDPPTPELPDRQPFVWNQNEYWSSLEDAFQQALTADHQTLLAEIDSGMFRIRELLTPFAFDSVTPEAPLMLWLETEMFEIAPKLAACPDNLRQYVDLYTLVRRTVKDQSRKWDMNSAAARNTIYRLLYGGRTALEEIMLQLSKGLVPPLIIADNEPSQAPSSEVLGVTIHSGDLLVSRGGAPTSALIARGSDYPGNFSHVALVHVDDDTGKPSIIEAHIERGVVIASVEEYLADKKLRVMVLRLRSDHPNIKTDPLLPHKAATLALNRARDEHIPYDFEMDYDDHSELFCSEVASAPYAQLGVKLWMGVSSISSIGVASWLAAFGITHFETQEPSDLEYDPQLRVVAEWRDPEMLWKDHVDNAVIDAMLEGAEAGDRLGYDRYLLPIARMTKAYCWLMNQFGGIGPIPEGMSASAALRNDRFSRKHLAIKKRVLELANRFREDHGYSPPYWELVALARKVMVDWESGS
jgi:hypothetical protein